MKSIKNSRKMLTHIGAPLALLFFVSASFTSTAHAYVQLTGSVGPGSRNANVTNLQEFLASMPNLYPEGIISGYFGTLTQRAVQRFQATYGIVSSGSPSSTGYGRVGPQTMARINSMISGGSPATPGSGSSLDTAGPMIMNVNRTASNISASFTFSTNEATNARVVYNTSPVAFSEGDINSNGFQAIGGYSANSNSGMSTSHSVTIPNLNPNTTYYYTIVATDASGNISVFGPNNVMMTNSQ